MRYALILASLGFSAAIACGQGDAPRPTTAPSTAPPAMMPPPTAPPAPPPPTAAAPPPPTAPVIMMPLTVTPEAVEAGKKVFMEKTCFACHGVDAKTPILPVYPRLAGQNQPYLLQQMRDIKSGTRSNGNTAAMRGIMHLVDDEDLQTASVYISQLPP